MNSLTVYGLPAWRAQAILVNAAHPASAAVRAVSVAADQVVPEVVRAVLARLDVPALVREYVDIDRLAAMLDVDAVVARVDLDAVMEKVDIDAVMDRVDLDAVVARLDLDRIVDKVDVSRVIDKVDLDQVVSRVDLHRAGCTGTLVRQAALPRRLRRQPARPPPPSSFVSPSSSPPNQAADTASPVYLLSGR